MKATSPIAFQISNLKITEKTHKNMFVCFFFNTFLNCSFKVSSSFENQNTFPCEKPFESNNSLLEKEKTMIFSMSHRNPTQ